MKIKILLALLALVFSCSSDNSKLYEWRGENRAGIYYESALLNSWPSNGPEELWALENIGNGYGSPVFVENKFYITGEIDSMAILFCFNLDGEKIWQTEFGREWTESYPGSRSAPTIVDDMIYVSSGMGNLYCVSAKDGSTIWAKYFTEDFQGIYPRFGHSEAILTDGDKLFFTPGGKTLNVVAMNRLTGELLWSNKAYSERSGYNPPKLITLADRHILVTFSAYHLMGFDTETGEMLWAHEQDNLAMDERIPGMGDTQSNTVLYEDGAIFYAAGDGNCGVRLDLSEDGSKITEVWRNKGFDSYMGGIVKLGDFLYGSGTAKKELRSINALTGQLTDSLRIGSGALIAADDMLYYYTQRGTLNLLNYDNGKMKLISSFRVQKGSNEHFSHPVIYQRVLYQRHGRMMMAYDIEEKKL